MEDWLGFLKADSHCKSETAKVKEVYQIKCSTPEEGGKKILEYMQQNI